MLMVYLLDEPSQTYWVHGHCECGDYKDFVAKTDAAHYADMPFHCTCPGCGIGYSLNKLVAAKRAAIKENHDRAEENDNRRAC